MMNYKRLVGKHGAGFLRNKDGSVVIAFALMMPFLVAFAGMAVDYSVWVSQRSDMQGTADAAALAAARAYSETQSAAQMESTVSAMLGAHGQSGAAHTVALISGNAVEVTLSEPGMSYFSGLMPFDPPTLSVRAVAATADAGINACVIALEPSAAEGIWLDSNAQIIAPNCVVHANSTNRSGIRADSNSLITGQEICVVGSYSGGNGHYNPDPTTGCETITDPLAGTTEPSTAGCLHTNYELDSVRRTIHPGVYCGGLTIKGNADVTFAPGTYVIKDGEFFVDSNSQIQGNEVAFYFTGTDATLFFDSNVVVDFTAPVSGALAGIIFFEDRSAPLLREHRLFSNNISRLEGAVYLSRGILWLDSNSQIAANSNFTSIVVRRLRLDSNAELVLNANYGASSVPSVTVSGATEMRLVE